MPVFNKKNKYRINQFCLYIVASLFLLNGCGGGGGSTAPVVTPPTTTALKGAGVKGPLANAKVTAYEFDATKADLKGVVIGSGTTDVSAQIVGLTIPTAKIPPFILEFTSDVNTTDITTGKAPVITTLRTVLTQGLVTSGNVYASLQTTMATDIAIANADSNTAPYSGDNNGTITGQELLNALPIAASQVMSTFGFGATSNVDIFTTPPLITATTITDAQQKAVAEYRTAIEAMTALLFELGKIAVPAQTAEAMLTAITGDLMDGIVDGMMNGAVSTVVNAAVLNGIVTIDPAVLPIPNTDNGTGTPYTVGQVETILVAEKAITGSTTPTTNLANGTIVVNPAPAKTDPDTDKDTIADFLDNCPLKANTNQSDTNNNGVGDVCDNAPIAVNDNITVNNGAIVTVLDSTKLSVLANDTDVEGDNLTATVVQKPVNAAAFLLNPDGTFSYQHNGSQTTSDSFTYTVFDGTSNSLVDATVIISVTTPVVGVDISGVWDVVSTVTSANPVGCETGTSKTVVSITQTGSVLDVVTHFGATYNGTIDNTGVIKFLKQEAINRSIPDISQPTVDTAFISWIENITINGTVSSPTAFSGTAVTDRAFAGVLDCSFTETYTANFVYKHTGNEQYSGLYADESLSTNESNGLNGRNSWVKNKAMTLEYDIVGTTLNISIPEFTGLLPSSSINITKSTYNPSNGFFTATIDWNFQVDFNGDNIAERSNVGRNVVTGIFMRAPTNLGGTNGTNGAPLSAVGSNIYAYSYPGVKAPGLNSDELEITVEDGYQKRLTSSGQTRTAVIRKGNQTNDSQILVGLANPPIKKIDVNSNLYFEVVDNTSKAILCSVPYYTVGATKGRYFQQINQQAIDVTLRQFRGSTYSTVNCNALPAVTNGQLLTLQIRDTGADGVKAGAVADTINIVDSVYSANVHPAPFTKTNKVFGIVLNGSRSSISMGGKELFVPGYFSLFQTDITWFDHPESSTLGVTNYQLRHQNQNDLIKFRYNRNPMNKSVTIQGGDLSDNDTLQVVAINKSAATGAVAMAFSRKVKIVKGINGFFNVEFSENIPIAYRTMQLKLSTDQNGVVSCKVTNNLNMSCGSTGNSINYQNDIVTISMTDVNGGLGLATGTTFRLQLNFTAPGTVPAVNSNTATAFSPDVTLGSSVATVATTELRLRSLRMSDGSVQSLVAFQNTIDPGVYDKAVFSVKNGTNIFTTNGTVDTDTNSATQSVWATASDFNAKVSTFSSPVIIGFKPQRNGRFISHRTNKDWGLGAELLATNSYKIVLSDSSSVAKDKIFYFNKYKSPDPSTFITPTFSQVTVNGTQCGTVITAGNISCDNLNPISILPANAGNFTISWNVASAPLNSRWRLVFTNIATGFQIRTAHITPGPANEITVTGTTNKTFTWTNPGNFVIGTGQQYRVQIRVDDGTTGGRYLLEGMQIKSDQVYIKGN